MKITVITVVFNGVTYLERCIQSVLGQKNVQLEYIIIDGKSTDGTLEIINKYRSKIDQFVSEHDNGMYDALNKGIKLATGDYVGILNADDVFASSDVLEKIVNELKLTNAEAIYSNLDYTDIKSQKTIRKWRTKQHHSGDFRSGWMPAHPTLYIQTILFEKIGLYSLNYGSAADYELMLRFIYTHSIRAVFLPILSVKMQVGGLSNAGFKNRWEGFKNDYKALVNAKIRFPLFVVFLKKIRKIKQYF